VRAEQRHSGSHHQAGALGTGPTARDRPTAGPFGRRHRPTRAAADRETPTRLDRAISGATEATEASRLSNGPRSLTLLPGCSTAPSACCCRARRASAPRAPVPPEPLRARMGPGAWAMADGANRGSCSYGRRGAKLAHPALRRTGDRPSGDHAQAAIVRMDPPSWPHRRMAEQSGAPLPARHVSAAGPGWPTAPAPVSASDNACTNSTVAAAILQLNAETGPRLIDRLARHDRAPHEHVARWSRGQHRGAAKAAYPGGDRPLLRSAGTTPPASPCPPSPASSRLGTGVRRCRRVALRDSTAGVPGQSRGCPVGRPRAQQSHRSGSRRYGRGASGLLARAGPYPRGCLAASEWRAVAFDPPPYRTGPWTGSRPAGECRPPRKARPASPWQRPLAMATDRRIPQPVNVSEPSCETPAS
jgi:hypothetical protein